MSLSALFPDVSKSGVVILLMFQLDKMPGERKITNEQLPLLAQIA